MKAASVHQIKQELEALSPAETRELLMRLARFRVENKEMLSYLIFYSEDEAGFVKTIKADIDFLFSEINLTHPYYIRKSVRKVLRLINKYIRFSGSRHTEAELLLFFCNKLVSTGILGLQHTAITNVFSNQLNKARKALTHLHDDLRHDYEEEIRALLKRM